MQPMMKISGITVGTNDMWCHHIVCKRLHCQLAVVYEPIYYLLPSIVHY